MPEVLFNLFRRIKIIKPITKTLKHQSTDFRYYCTNTSIQHFTLTMITKQQLLDELVNNTYVVLRPSPVAGIGVFALRDIPKGTRNLFSAPEVNDHWIKISKAEVDTLPPSVQFLIGNYCLFDAESYFVPDHGFKKVDVCLFLNHNDNPNVVSINEGEYFEAMRDISEGEELFIYYGDEQTGEPL